MSSRDPLGWVGNTLDDRVAVADLIGEGGFGYVYRGTHLGFDEPVALKCLKIPAQLNEEERATFLHDFRTEARLLHRLSRKTAGIVQALDVGAAVSPKGIWSPYIVMEWLEGQSLENELNTRAVRGLAARTPAEAVALLRPAADALAVAHGSNIAHLDVKPANLFIAEQDGDTTIKVLDFGIARVLTTSNTVSRALTEHGSPAAFTPNYAAPEQFNQRHGRPGAQTDVFALALVVIELVTGQPALDGTTPLQLYVSAANEHFRPSLTAAGVEVGEEVEQALARALAVNPAKRYPDAGSFWTALAAAVEGTVPGLALPPSVQVSVVPAPLQGSRSFQATARAATAYATARPASGQHRVCTVLVAELTGTSALARHLDPELLAEVVDQVFDLLRATVEDAEGTVEEMVGDRLVATFGLHTDSVAAAERAVRAALAMPASLASFALPRGALRGGGPRVRLGLATGRVFLRQDTRSTGRGLTVTGAPLALATRLAQTASSDQVVIGRDAHRQVAGLFDVEAFELSPPDEGETPVKAFRVMAAAGGRAARGIVVEREFHGAPTRILGRAAELETLLAVAREAAEASRARLVTLVGPAGVGRSRTMLEVVSRLEDEGQLVLATHGSPLQTRTSYALAAALVRGRFRISEDDSREIAAAKIAEGIVELRARPTSGDEPHSMGAGRLRFAVMDPDEIAEQLLRVLGHRAEMRSGVTQVTADERSTPIKHRIAGAFAALFAAARRPVALVCDDVHWADEASLELFDDLLVRSCDQPLAVVCSSRPALLETRPSWGDDDGVREVVRLRPLARAQLEKMVRDRLARIADLPDGLVRELAERAEGSPLALVETLHLLIDDGAIDVSDGEHWQLHGEKVAELAALPTTVQGLVQARLDRLDEASLQLLCQAAVIGRTFWDGALASLTGTTRAEVTVSLADLSARGLVRRRPASTFPDEQEYGFCERATQQVAYDMLGMSARREIHRLVAQWLEERAPGDATAALVARHYENAAALQQALTAYLVAASHAASVGQNAEACHCYERASGIDAWMTGEVMSGGATGEIYIGWVQPEDPRITSWPERVGLHCAFGDVLRRMGELDRAASQYERAKGYIITEERRTDSSIDPLEVPRWQARIGFRLSLVKDVRGAVAEAQQLVAQAIADAEAAVLVEERAQMLAHQAGLHLREGNLEAGQSLSLAGLRVCREAPRRGERWREAVAWLLRTLGGTLYRRGRMIGAERCYLQAARVLDERTNPYAVARVLNNVAATRFARGDVTAARDSFRRTLELADRSGDLWTTMTALGNLGEVEQHLGRSELAREYLDEAVRLGERIGARAELAECYRNLAVVLAAGEQLAPGLEAAARALALARGGGGEPYLPGVAMTIAELCAEAATGDHADTARELARSLVPVLDGDSIGDDLAARCREQLAPLLDKGD